MDFQRELRHTPILRQTMYDFVQSKKSVVRVCVSKMEGPRPDKFAFGVRIGRVVDGCRPAKGCIKKWVHGSANGQPELSTTEEVNVKNMEVFL